MAPSKTFNIPGAGSALAVISNPKLRDAYRLAGERMALLSLPGIFSAEAALAAYKGGEHWLDELLAYLWDNYQYLRQFFAEALPSLTVSPLEGTYLAWLDFSAYGLADAELKRILREDARVRLNDGPSFGPGGEGFQRLNFACPRKTLTEALGRIASAFAPHEKRAGGNGAPA
jgi:cystathionine beta-lyase